MSKKIYAGFVTIIKPIDRRLCVSVIQEDNSNKYKLVFSENFIEINNQIMDITDYTVLDTFSDLAKAVASVPLACIALDWHIRDIVEKHGGQIRSTKITFDGKERWKRERDIE